MSTTAENMALSGKRVLIADDSATERVNLKQILEAQQCEVIEAKSGNEAKTLAAQEQPAIIMLDIIMDDGDGYQACRALKRNPDTQHIPVIMVSSKSNPVDKLWAKQQGAAGYVVKPYEATDILNELAAI